MRSDDVLRFIGVDEIMTEYSKNERALQGAWKVIDR